MARIIGTSDKRAYIELGARGGRAVDVDEAGLDARDRAIIADAWVNPAGEVITVRRVAGDVEAWRFAGIITVTLAGLAPDTEAAARRVLLDTCGTSAAANR